MFVVGSYRGSSKPKRLGDCVNDTMRELGEMLKQGIKMCLNGQHIDITLH